MEELASSFPVNGILPKKETGSLAFLAKNPTCDGRGVLIAILDTGVDPAAPGLQLTSESKPKIIDIIDATGTGDVDISTVQKVDSEGHLTGLTGRKLKVPSKWTNPSGEYRLGIKALYDVAPKPLRDRLARERKENHWQTFNDQALAEIQAKLVQAKSSSASNKEKTQDNQVSSSDGSSIDSKSSSDLKDYLSTLIKEDLQTQAEIVKELDSKIKDVGPVYDCIVWNDGTTWWSCIDTTETGDLESCKVLTNYKDSRQYATFSYLDMLSYSVRILPEQNLLSIVTDSGSHGTHVAGIAAAYYPDQPELNGVAPGAQIISIKIGDGRIDGMETGYALVNACRFVAEYKCDLVNYSFGEPVNSTHQGPALNAVQELVEKYGVIYCTSAGNNGPGIETNGAPATSVHNAISVAAYVTYDMLKAEHSLLLNTANNKSNASSMLFSWSSRGPSFSGDRGVTVCAPGGAFASVPNWTQCGTQLKSGTSMASPNLCGCLALVLSSLKQQSIYYTPYSIKRALENTSNAACDETIGVGAGLVQVEKLHEYLVGYKDHPDVSVSYEVRYLKKAQSKMCGIYLKSSDEVSETRDHLITIEPVFFENRTRSIYMNESIEHDLAKLELQKEKIALSKKIALVVESELGSTSWIECPPYLCLTNSTRQFHIRLHPQQLDAGKFYYAQVKAYDLDDTKRKNCLFYVPISVVKPYTFNQDSEYQVEYKDLVFKQGQIHRNFIRAPLGATHAEIEIKCQTTPADKDHSPLFFLQTFTLGNFRNQYDEAHEEITRLNATYEHKAIVKVQSNKILQVTVAKNWSNIGNLVADCKVKFRGLFPRNFPSELAACQSSQPLRLEIDSLLRRETCEPSVQWKHHVQPLRPTEHQIELVNPAIGTLKSIYQIVLSYNFNQPKACEVGCEVPLLSHCLYESEYQSAFWSIYESVGKKKVLSGDAFPQHYKYSRTLEKGDYLIRLFVRHEKLDQLEKLKDLWLHVRSALSGGGLTSEIYSSMGNLQKCTGGKKASKVIAKGGFATYYIGSVSGGDEKLPKNIQPGHYLVGELSLFKDESQVAKVDFHRIQYNINAAPSKGSKNALQIAPAKSEKAKKSEEDKLLEAMRDIQVLYVSKINEMYETLITNKGEFSSHVPVYVNRIQYLEHQISSLENDSTESGLEKKISLYEDIVNVSKTGIENINQDELLKHLGEKNNDPSVTTDEIKKEFENQKSWIIELLVSQGVALVEKYNLNKKLNKTESKSSLNEQLLKLIRSLQKWIDLSDEKCFKFMIKFYILNSLYGKALKLLFKQSDDKPSKQIDTQILRVLNDLNLSHAAKYLTNSSIIRHHGKFVNF